MQNSVSETSRPPSGTIAKRPVAAEDDCFLLKVYASTREEEMALVDWSKKQREVFLRSQLTAQRKDYESRYPASTHQVLLLDGEPVGQIWIATTDDEVRLLDIAILPKYRRRGLGTALLKELQEEQGRRGKPLRHCVYKENRTALAFYARLGFGVRDDLGLYYLMEWNSEDSTRTSATR
jgi:ribosomal protein S18 acetylase RimI-like enzyme